MAYDAFLDLDGIEGESTRKGMEKKIEITAFGYGVTNSTSIGSGGGGGSGKSSLMDLNFSKFVDAASPLIFQACASGKHFPKAKLILHKAGGDEALDYLVFEMEKCYITSYQVSGSSGSDDRPMDSFTLTYGKGTYTITPQMETGAKGAPAVGSWDQTTVST